MCIIHKNKTQICGQTTTRVLLIKEKDCEKGKIHKKILLKLSHFTKTILLQNQKNGVKFIFSYFQIKTCNSRCLSYNGEQAKELADVVGSFIFMSGDDFMEKYRIDGSRALYEQLKEYVPGGVGSSFHKPKYRDYPVAVAYGKGSRLYDVDGNEYIDYIAGFGPMLLGYAPESVNKAVQEQLKSGSHFSAPTYQMLELAGLLTEVIPSAEMVSFQNSGTEVVMQALRLARAYTGKYKIIKFEGQYHGWADEEKVTTTASNVEELGDRESPNKILSTKGMKPNSADWLILAPWNDLDYLERIMKEQGDEIAAVITEPIMCDSGPILPKGGFLKGLRELTKKYKIVLIFDEVITGFRVSLGGAQEYYGVTPDLSTFAKAVTAGYPFGVVAGKKEIMSCGVPASGTFNANPVGVAAAIAAIKELQEPGTYRHLQETGDALLAGFRKLAEKYHVKIYTRAIGGIFVLYFGFEEDADDFRDWLTKADIRFYEEFVKRCEEYGVRFTDERGREYISTAHTQEDVARTLQVADLVLSEMTKDGWSTARGAGE